MPYFVYVSDECTTDLQRHSKEVEVERLREKIEASQTVVSLDRFPPPFLKKRLGRMRLIIEERRLSDDVTLICFVRLVFRGDSVYSAFCESPESIRSTYRLDPDVLGKFAASRLSTPLPQNPALSPIEEGYLQAAATSPHHDYGIFLETGDWVERIQLPARRPYLASYAELVQDISTHQHSSETIRIHERLPNVAILYRHIEARNTAILIAPVDPADDHDIAGLRSRYAHLLSSPESLSPDELLRISRRSYPAIITLDPNLWLSTQQSVDANLALSPEETAIVESIRMDQPSHDGGSRMYPLFINGRPGSGKSTVLQFLFADLVFFHLTRPLQERLSSPPLYLTYSAPLLKRARDVVEDILRCDASKQLDGTAIEPLELKQTLDASFCQFRPFLLQQLPSAHARQFPQDRFVDFPRFRQLWAEEFSRSANRDLREIGPEVAWHVIRTYIKGMREESGEYFDVDCYREHPAKRRTVEEATFQLVFEQVFSRWYRDLSEKDGWWDDQDLTRKVLALHSDLPCRPAVFCDEAQDFTKLELEFIFGLSVYAYRQIPKHLLHKVPFAFAGDPFQTLNPTGFSWSSVQADFHEKIVANIDRSTSRSLKFNFKELAFNYRSAEPIVRLCNSIQLLRGIGFEIKQLAPQKTWFLASASVPEFFEDTDPLARQNLQADEEAVIIVPCHEGGESDYVANDPFLRSFALQNDELRRNVFSPMRAKGLEFSRVVLYRFGEDACETPGVLTLVRELRPVGTTDTLPAEYYFNRLYVGASRARTRLLIVDSKLGLEGFWGALSRQGAADRLLSAYSQIHARAGDSGWGLDDLGRLVPGTEESWAADRDEPEKLAKSFLEQGKTMRDPYFLERAKDIFSRIGQTHLADECNALLLEFTGRLDEAGGAYVRLKKFDRAIQCWWHNDSFRQISELRDESSVTSKPEFAAASFMASTRNKPACERFLLDLFSFAQEVGTLSALLGDARWPRVANVLVDSFATLSDSALGPAEWKRTLTHIRFCTEAGLGIAASLSFARIAHRAGDMRTAADTWEKLRQKPDEPSWITEALARTRPYPASLPLYARLAAWSEIVDLFDENRDARLAPDAAHFVVRALLHQGRFEDSVTLLAEFPDEEQLSTLLFSPNPAVSKAVAARAADCLLAVIEHGRRWDDLLKFATSLRLKGRRIESGSPIAALDPAQMREPSIRVLAVSEGLAAEQSRDAKRKIADLLRAELLDPGRRAAVAVTVGQAAAAIERAGRFTDALQFYESLFPVEGEVRRFARERWLINKQRQIDSEKDPRRQGPLISDRRRNLERWQITEDRLRQAPQYPDARQPDVPLAMALAPQSEARVATTTPASPQKPAPSTPPEGLAGHSVSNTDKPRPRAAAGETVTQSRPLSVVLNWNTGAREFEATLLPAARRLEVRDVATGHLIVVLAASLELRSTDFEDITNRAGPGVLKQFAVESWQLHCSLSPLGARTLVELSIEGVDVIALAL